MRTLGGSPRRSSASSPRGALGADRWRLLGHLAADSALLALGGGLVALPLATGYQPEPLMGWWLHA